MKEIKILVETNFRSFVFYFTIQNYASGYTLCHHHHMVKQLLDLKFEMYFSGGFVCFSCDFHVTLTLQISLV